MTHRRLGEILSRASAETDENSGDDYIPSIEESDNTSENFNSDSSADSGDDLPMPESLKGLLSKMCNVKELIGEKDDMFIVPDVAEFAEIGRAHSEALTS
jgi:hypothetical protein